METKVKKRKINDQLYIIGEDYKKPKKGYCYKYKDGNYYPYYGRWDNNKTAPTGLYNKDGKVYFHKRKNTDSSDLILDILKNKNIIAENTNKAKKQLSEEEMENIFLPVINENDTILVKLIKEEIRKAKIPEKELQTRFETPGEWNNYKRALRIRPTITIEGFSRWMEILNKKWKIIIED